MPSTSSSSSVSGSSDSSRGRNTRNVKPKPVVQTKQRSVSSESTAESTPEPIPEPIPEPTPEPTPEPPIQATSIGPFEAEYGDVLLSVKGEGLSTHKYLLQRFSVLEAKLLESSSNGARPTYVLEEESIVPEDFHNAFKILYSSPLDSTFNFDATVFVSALRLATLYDYPALRAYSITHLNEADLGPIRRIEIARECNLPEWEEPAYIELGEREEPITAEEAFALGLETLADISRRREVALRNKLRSPEPNAPSSSPSPPLVPRVPIGRRAPAIPDLGISTPAMVTQDYSTSPTASRSNSRMSSRRVNGTKSGTVIKSKKERAKAHPKPCFIDAPPPGQKREGSIKDVAMIELVVADCQCKTYLNPREDPVSGQLVSQVHQVACKLPSCAVQAFKHIQKEQIVYAERVDKLEALLERITSDPVLMRRPPT